MPLVSTTQLTAIRNIAYRGLDTPVTIQRKTVSEGDFGGVETWNTVTTTNGWLREMTTTKPFGIASLLQTVGTFRLHLAVGTDIQPGDRAVVNGVEFEVNDTNADNTLQVFTTAILRRTE